MLTFFSLIKFLLFVLTSSFSFINCLLVCKQVNKQLKKEWKWIQDVNTIRIYKEIEWQLSSFFPFSIFYLIGTWGPWRSNKKKMERNLLTFGHIIKKKLESPNVYKRRFHGKESSAQRSDPWAGLIASCGSFGLMVCNRRTSAHHWIALIRSLWTANQESRGPEIVSLNRAALLWLCGLLLLEGRETITTNTFL